MPHPKIGAGIRLIENKYKYAKLKKHKKQKLISYD